MVQSLAPSWKIQTDDLKFLYIIESLCFQFFDHQKEESHLMSLVTEVALGNAIQLKFFALVGTEYPMPPLGVFFVVFGLFSFCGLSLMSIFSFPCFSSRNLNQSWVMLAVFGFPAESATLRLVVLLWWRVAPSPPSNDYGIYIRTLQLSSLIYDSLFPILVLSSFFLSCTPKRILSFLYWKTSLSLYLFPDWLKIHFFQEHSSDKFQLFWINSLLSIVWNFIHSI